MATQVESFHFEASARARRLGVVRFASAAGLSAAFVFILCWLGTLIPFSSPTHAYIALFTPAPMQSVQALGEGTLWSLLFGVLTGAVFALVYNLLATLDRR